MRGFEPRLHLCGTASSRHGPKAVPCRAHFDEPKLRGTNALDPLFNVALWFYSTCNDPREDTL